mmetsp:Transcript_47843/g.108570  ORF Transcript_47843/g.108570 Transcript_47843/m.108570 type:complete len:397 (+) Transcript_47843:1-1191(+)
MICMKLLEWAPPPFSVRPPEETGGISRVSIWLQHVPPSTTVPARVLNNLTYYLWFSEIDAVEELRRRLLTCEQHQDPCEAVVRAHLKIAESRLPHALEARMEARSPIRAHRRIQVVTTVYNCLRWNQKAKEVEGNWVLPMSEQDSSVKYLVLSATPIPNGTFEDTLPDPTLFTSPNIDVQPFANPGRAQECPGVMSYLVENYNELPDIMIFLHGYPFDHNPWLEEQLFELFKINRNYGLPEFRFVHLNLELHPKCVLNRAPNGQSRLLGLDEELFNKSSSKSFGMPRSEICYSAKFCCGQFLVSRKAVLARPRSFYRLALKLAREQGSCNQLEFLWHAIFRREARFTGLNLGQFLDEFEAKLEGREFSKPRPSAWGWAGDVTVPDGHPDLGALRGA